MNTVTAGVQRLLRGCYSWGEVQLECPYTSIDNECVVPDSWTQSLEFIFAILDDASDTCVPSRVK